MRKIRSLALVTFCLQGSLLLAQTPFFQQYHPLKKSQPAEVKALLQDEKGFVWLGTDKGLFQFDGVSFRQYTTNDSLADDRVTALAEDSLGRIWAGHESGELSYLDKGVTHRFESREGSAVEAVSDILFDSRGTMWFSTKGDGLYYFVNDRLYRVDEAEGLPDIFIYDLFEDSSGNIWAGTDRGIAVCSLSDRKITIDVIDSGDGLSDIIIKRIRPVNGDTIALATEDEGILTYNTKTKEILPLSRGGWDHGTISDFVVKEGQVWIAAPRKGLVVYDRRTRQTKVFEQFDGRALQSANSLLKDREGNIWSGSKHGLFRTMGDALEPIEVLQQGRQNNVLSVTVDDRERIWFSTPDGLFVRSAGSDGSASVTKRLEGTAFQNAPVISLYTDASGYIWAGLYGDGLLRIHPDRREVKHFQKELRNGNILSITGKGNRIWVATLGGASSLELDGDRYIITNYGSADGLSSDFIYQVFIDSRDRTWFATDGKGVTMQDEKGFHHYQDGLSSRVVYSIAEDSDKNIWVTSQDNGVYRFDEGKFVTVPEMRLRDNSIHALAADSDGNLIAVHNFGIDVYNVRSKRMRYWGEEAGIRDKRPNLNAVGRDSYGKILIGTTRGMMRFSLNNDHASYLPQPLIDRVKIFGEDIDISGPAHLSYDENNITIHFLGFWYQNATNLNYLFKLDNYDLEWIATRNQDVTYSQLPPGEYTFRLKVSDTDDFSQASEASVSFSISPPFWRTGTFYVFIAAIFFISAYGLMKFRERRLLEDKLILEARVEERTKEIQQKTEEIQAQNEEIMAQAEEIQGINENLEMLVKERTAELEKKNKALEEYAFINAHKLRSPVASILGLVNLLAKSDQREDTKVIREHLQQSADKLDAVVRSITEAIEKADNKYL